MKNRIKMAGTGLAGLMTVALAAAPAPARAGEREWATAGKILTGVVAAHILLDSRTPIGILRTAPPPARPGYGRTGCPGRARYLPDTRYPGHGFPPAGRYPAHGGYSRRHGGFARVPAPIVIPLRCGRRLYQPPIAGHPAMIQQWRHGAWVTVGTHPPIR